MKRRERAGLGLVATALIAVAIVGGPSAAGADGEGTAAAKGEGAESARSAEQSQEALMAHLGPLDGPVTLERKDWDAKRFGAWAEFRSEDGRSVPADSVTVTIGGPPGKGAAPDGPSGPGREFSSRAAYINLLWDVDLGRQPMNVLRTSSFYLAGTGSCLFDWQFGNYFVAYAKINLRSFPCAADPSSWVRVYNGSFDNSIRWVTAMNTWWQAEKVGSVLGAEFHACIWVLPNLRSCGLLTVSAF